MSVIKTPIFGSYLLEAARNFLLDTGKRPHLNVDIDEVHPPHLSAYARGGRITFNLSEQSVQNFSIIGNVMSFTTRFNGISTDVQVTMLGVSIIYDPDAEEKPLHLSIDYSEYEVADPVTEKPKSKSNPFKVIHGGKSDNQTHSVDDEGRVQVELSAVSSQPVIADKE